MKIVNGISNMLISELETYPLQSRNHFKYPDWKEGSMFGITWKYMFWISHVHNYVDHATGNVSMKCGRLLTWNIRITNHVWKALEKPEVVIII